MKNIKYIGSLVIEAMLLPIAELNKSMQASIEYNKRMERERMKYYKTVQKETFWGYRTTYIERDVPLTDEELNNRLNF